MFQVFGLTVTQTISLIALIVYFTTLITVNWWQKRHTTAAAYAIGSRNVGYIATTGSLAAGVRDGSGIVLWISFGFANGYGGLWLFAGVFLALCLMAWFGPRARHLSIARDYVTINQMLRDDIGVISEKTTSVIMLCIALLIMAMQIYVAGNLFASLLHQPSWIGMVGIALIVGTYLFAGGYSAVVRTDTIQFFLIISLISIPFFIHVPAADIHNYSSLFSLPQLDRIALFFIGFLYPIANGDIWQRIFSARTDRVLRVSFPMAGPALIIMTLSLIFLGFGIKAVMPDAKPDEALFQFYQAELISPGVLAYIAAVVMAITTSALDTHTYLFTATFLKNLAPRRIRDDHIAFVRWARLIIVAALIFTTLIALTIGNIVAFLFQAVSLMYVLGPVFLFAALGWLRRERWIDWGITATVIGSGVVFTVLFALQILDGRLIMSLVPTLVSLIGCSVIALIAAFKKPHSLQLEQTLSSV